MNTLFNKAIDVVQCESLSDGTSIKHNKHVLRVGLSLKSKDLMKIGLALLIRQTVDPHAYPTAFTLSDLYETLMRLSVKPAEHYRNYEFVFKDSIFHLHEIIILLKHAASHLLVGDCHLNGEQIANLVKAKVKGMMVETENV